MIYQNCLINLVTETFYHSIFNKVSHLFFSEKIWKPIACRQIFILLGPQKGLKHLRKAGFKTFGDYIDESYDNLGDSERLFAVIDSLNETMKRYSLEEIDHLTKPIREYNYIHIKQSNPYLQQPIKNVLK